MPAEAQLLTLLDHMDRHCNALSQAVLTGEADALEAHSALLRDSAVALAELLAQTGPLSQWASSARALSEQRLARASQILAWARAGMARRHAVVERTLNALLPTSQSMTYTAPARAYSGSAPAPSLRRPYAA